MIAGRQGRFRDDLSMVSRIGPQRRQSMVPIARGQAIEMSLWPPSPVIHACWMDDAEHDSGEPVVVAACGAYAAPEDVHETDAPIDCMTCLVRHARYDRSLDEDSPD